MLLGTLIAGLAGFILGALAGLGNGWSRPDEVLLTVVCLIEVILICGIYFVNRSGLVRPASIVFLVGLLLLISVSDEAAQLVAGRSTIAYVLPIVMASVLLNPLSSFVMAILSGVALFMLALTNGLLPDIFLTLLVELAVLLLVALVRLAGGAQPGASSD